MLTKGVVSEIYNEELENVKSLFPINKWFHQPASLIEFTNSKSVLGLAYPCGKVEVNERFLGTATESLLRNTIRHELSHLVVGTHHCHNKHFKAVATYLDVRPNSDFPELDCIIDKISFKYMVYAHLTDGTTVKIGGVHRKTKKYTNYNDQEIKNMSVKSIPVNTFEFRENY